MFDRWFYALFGVLVAIAAGHFLGIYTEGYRAFWWLDIITHFLGGFWVGGMVLWGLWARRYHMPTPVVAGAAAFLVGIAWEVFEVWSDPLLSGERGYFPDMILDLIMDITGGVLAGILFVRNKK